MRKGKVLLKVKDELDGALPSKGKAPAHPKGVKLEEDSNETTAEPPNRGYKLPDAAQVNEAREALRSSLMDLLRGVVDKNNNGGSTYVPKSSFMRNTNAVKYERDESVGGSPEDIAYRHAELPLPRPERTNASPLNTYQSGNRKRRRSSIRWTNEEVQALLMGVAENGRSNWNRILHSYRSVFNGARTGVDLKDKWRNLTR